MNNLFILCLSLLSSLFSVFLCSSSLVVFTFSSADSILHPAYSFYFLVLLNIIFEFHVCLTSYHSFWLSKMYSQTQYLTVSFSPLLLLSLLFSISLSLSYRLHFTVLLPTYRFHSVLSCLSNYLSISHVNPPYIFFIHLPYLHILSFF